MEEEKQPDNGGETGLSEEEKRLEEKKAQREGLEKALQDEEILVAEREERLRALREKRQELAKEEEVAGKTTPQPKADNTSEIVSKVRREILSETKSGNLKEAKKKFYKTEIGKRYDPLNDSSGKLWKELEDYLHLTDNDLTIEAVLRKIQGAALAHGQDNFLVSDEQRKRNEEEAKKSLGDLGSGGRSSGERPGMSAPPADKPTKDDEAEAARLGVKLESYMRAKNKVLQRKAR